MIGALFFQSLLLQAVGGCQWRKESGVLARRDRCDKCYRRTETGEQGSSPCRGTLARRTVVVISLVGLGSIKI